MVGGFFLWEFKGVQGIGSIGAWFYRGSRKPVAHWIFHAGNGPLCGRLKPRADGFVWRHPSHDRHIPKCTHCLVMLKKEPAPKSSAHEPIALTPE